MSIGNSDFGVQVGLGFLGKVITALVAFLGSIFLARVLGPAEYGTFYILMALVSFLDNPVTGWAVACRKRFTEKDGPKGQILGSIIIGVGFASVLLLLLAYIMSSVISQVTGDSNAWILFTTLYFGMVSYVTSLEVLKATRRFGYSTWLQAARDIMRVLAQSLFVIVGLGVSGMVGGIVLPNLILAPLIFYYIGPRPRLPSRDTLYDIWTYAQSSIPDGLLSTAQERMDILLLGLLSTQSIAGNYEVAMKLTMPAIFISGVASNGLMGRISNRKSKDEKIEDDVQNNLAFASIIAIPLFFGAITIGKPVVVTVYSSDYMLAGTFISGLAFFRLIRTQKSILISTINGLNHPDQNLRVSAIEFTINIVFGIFLFLRIGPIGVIIATVISELAAYIIRVMIVKQHLPNIDFLPRQLLEQCASGILMAVVVYTISYLIGVGSWYKTVLIVFIGGGVYFSSLFVISKGTRDTVKGLAEDSFIRDKI